MFNFLMSQRVFFFELLSNFMLYTHTHNTGGTAALWEQDWLTWVHSHGDMCYVKVRKYDPYAILLFLNYT